MAERGLTFNRLRTANVKRCEHFYHKVSGWTLPDWACAAAGEMGEVCNVVKKLHRGNYANQTIDEEDLRNQLAEELADVVIYLDLLAARAGIDLGENVVKKFNKTSLKVGSSIMLWK